MEFESERTLNKWDKAPAGFVEWHMILALLGNTRSLETMPFSDATEATRDLPCLTAMWYVSHILDRPTNSTLSPKEFAACELCVRQEHPGKAIVTPC